MLRPIPDLSNAQQMTKLGQLSALRSARLDALHQMRDAFTRLQSEQCDEAAEMQRIREGLDRLDELARLSSNT